MDLSIEKIILLFVAGLLVGFVNVISGGGSLISIPIMIFLGLPAPVANASSRVGIFVQNLVAVKTFQSKGYTNIRLTYWLAISALLGSVIGSMMAVNISHKTFQLVLAIMMVLMIVLMTFNPKNIYADTIERLSNQRQFYSVILFFGLGIYGGFIQAGTAVMMMLALRWINNINLAKINHMKVFIVLGMNLLSLIIFQWNGIINWEYGIALASGTGIGGYYGALFSIEKGEIWIKRFVIMTLIAMAIKLIYNFFQ